MAYEFQVTVDCADPHILADWWAETLGWQVQEQDEAFIRRMISAGYAADSDTRLHNGRLVWTQGAAIAHPEGTQRAPRVLFQLVPEAKTVKNRLHLDLQPQDRSREEEVERLLGLGATLVADFRKPDGTGWVVLADIEGNEFCVERSHAERILTGDI